MLRGSCLCGGVRFEIERAVGRGRETAAAVLEDGRWRMR